VSTSGLKVELHKEIVLSVNHPFIHTKYSILYYGSISFSLTTCTVLFCVVCLWSASISSLFTILCKFIGYVILTSIQRIIFSNQIFINSVAWVMKLWYVDNIPKYW